MTLCGFSLEGTGIVALILKQSNYFTKMLVCTISNQLLNVTGCQTMQGEWPICLRESLESCIDRLRAQIKKS